MHADIDGDADSGGALLQALHGRVAIASKRISPGAAASFEVASGQLIQIVTVDGRQAAEMIAFGAEDHAERLSTAATRSKNKSIMVEAGKSLYSSRFTPMLELVSDSVGRHDLLMASSEPVKPTTFDKDGDEELTHPLVEALNGHGIGLESVLEPVNWFANISIKSKGELDVNESLAEPNDSVVLKALMDLVVVVGARKNLAGTGITATDIVVRIFR
jgi:uncharacterized protein YcgI (DUF1989 family)